MRVLNGIEALAVAGGIEALCWDSFSADSGFSDGGGSTGEFARMDGATYRSEPVDFCGNQSLNVPDSIFGVYQGEACLQHDVCYTEAVVSRATCDAQFLTNMLANCGSNVLCQVGAVVYYVGVRIGGSSSYGTPLQ